MLFNQIKFLFRDAIFYVVSQFIKQESRAELIAYNLTKIIVSHR